MRMSRKMAAQAAANYGVSGSIYYSLWEKKMGLVRKRKVVRVNGSKWEKRGSGGN